MCFIDVWDTGFADVYHDNLYALSVEQYVGCQLMMKLS